MDNYDVNIKWGVARVRVYIQQFEYKGFYEVEITGNIKGESIIEEAIDADDLEPQDIIRSNCKLKINESEDDEEYFTCTLKNYKGDTLDIDGDLDCLEDLIVGVKIISFIEKEK